MDFGRAPLISTLPQTGLELRCAQGGCAAYVACTWGLSGLAFHFFHTYSSLFHHGGYG